MKQKNIFYSFLFSGSLLAACNSGTDTSSSTTVNDSTTVTTTGTDTGGMAGMEGMNHGTAYSNTALEGMDKEFVMKAAAGGMMEVEAGRIAQEAATNQRVKDFGAMMVRDHSAANDELKSLASAKGLMIPEDSLMMKHKPHMDELRSKKGAAFDRFYMSEMVKDHNKDVAEFEKATTSAMDADVKAFATKTLPTLRMHKDSAEALNKLKF